MKVQLLKKEIKKSYHQYLSKALFFFNLFIVITLNAQNKDYNPYYITPEDFGCISDDSQHATKNAINLQKAIDYACEKGLTLISSANKKYYINKSLTIKNFINIDFGRGTIIASDSINMIIISNGKSCKWAGSIKNIRLDLNRKAKVGFLGEKCIKLKISDGEIVNIGEKGIGISIKTGYEVFVENMHFLGDQKSSTGIKVQTSDCHFSDCVMIDCYTAIFNIGSNFYERIHAWMGERWIIGSTFFKCSGYPIFLNQCFSDTFDRTFDIIDKTELHITQFKLFQNINMWKNYKENINPTLFYFRYYTSIKDSHIKLIDSHIGKLIIDKESKENKQKTSNFENINLSTIESTIL